MEGQETSLANTTQRSPHLSRGTFKFEKAKHVGCHNHPKMSI